MVFDWFRRKFEDQPQTEISETENQTLEQTPESQPLSDRDSVEPTQPEADPDSQEVSKDLLSWAKAAYSNIQQSQEINQESIELPSETEPEVFSAKDREIAQLQIQPEATPEIPSPTPQPFWAMSEAERQARIAALAATAIAEPETISTPQTTQARPSSFAQLPFDESFLWSSEVLAAQGRRPDDISVEEITWLNRLRQGLDKTRLNLVNQLKSLVGQGPLDANAVEQIEALLLQADVGVEATDRILAALQAKLKTEALPPAEGIAFLKQILCEILDTPLAGKEKFVYSLAPEKNQLNIWLITGVNGAGKTTTIGKLAHLSSKSGYRTLIAAADTFRAAAVEQIKVWGDRSGVEVIANPGENTDPASVVFDAIIAAQSRGTELLLVDTAGRLQNKKNLMDELSKIRRIVDKKAGTAKIESLLVLDATLGQNGLRQAEIFSQSANLTGIVLTKLDGSAKGGVAIAVVQKLGLPIRFIGAGEGIQDLRPFSSYEFVEALLSN
jgi:fused signal recognition particle receptor